MQKICLRFRHFFTFLTIALFFPLCALEDAPWENLAFSFQDGNHELELLKALKKKLMSAKKGGDLETLDLVFQYITYAPYIKKKDKKACLAYGLKQIQFASLFAPIHQRYDIPINQNFFDYAFTLENEPLLDYLQQKGFKFQPTQSTLNSLIRHIAYYHSEELSTEEEFQALLKKRGLVVQPNAKTLFPLIRSEKEELAENIEKTYNIPINLNTLHQALRKDINRKKNTYSSWLEEEYLHNIDNMETIETLNLRIELAIAMKNWKSIPRIIDEIVEHPTIQGNGKTLALALQFNDKFENGELYKKLKNSGATPTAETFNVAIVEGKKGVTKDIATSIKAYNFNPNKESFFLLFDLYNEAEFKTYIAFINNNTTLDLPLDTFHYFIKRMPNKKEDKLVDFKFEDYNIVPNETTVTKSIEYKKWKLYNKLRSHYKIAPTIDHFHALLKQKACLTTQINLKLHDTKEAQRDLVTCETIMTTLKKSIDEGTLIPTYETLQLALRIGDLPLATTLAGKLKLDTNTLEVIVIELAFLHLKKALQQQWIYLPQQETENKEKTLLDLLGKNLEQPNVEITFPMLITTLQGQAWDLYFKLINSKKTIAKNTDFLALLHTTLLLKIGMDQESQPHETNEKEDYKKYLLHREKYKKVLDHFKILIQKKKITPTSQTLRHSLHSNNIEFFELLEQKKNLTTTAETLKIVVNEFDSHISKIQKHYTQKNEKKETFLSSFLETTLQKPNLKSDATTAKKLKNLYDNHKDYFLIKKEKKFARRVNHFARNKGGKSFSLRSFLEAQKITLFILFIITIGVVILSYFSWKKYALKKQKQKTKKGKKKKKTKSTPKKRQITTPLAQKKDPKKPSINKKNPHLKSTTR